MQKRRLGKTDLELTTVGLGTWAIGGPWQWGWSHQDDSDSIETIQAAIESGINWLDTAPCYGVGHSERVVGEALKGMARRPLIATKCGIVWEEPADGTVDSCLKADSVRRELENSLQRLDVDVIDLYQIHWPIPDEDIEVAWQEMTRAVEEGLVRHIGVSNFSIQQMERLMGIHPIASLQPPYSMLRRDIENETLAWCAANEVGVLAYSPMQAGLLTGTFSRERRASLPADDWRHGNRHFQSPLFERHLETVRLLEPLAREMDLSMAQLAISWVLAQKGVTAAIVGARKPAQIRETSPSSEVDLPVHLMKRIDDVLTRPH